MHVSAFSGRLLPRTNPYYGEVLHYLKAIHFAHSTEMKNLLVEKVNLLLQYYETHGQDQHGKHTTKACASSTSPTLGTSSRSAHTMLRLLTTPNLTFPSFCRATSAKNRGTRGS
jgi:hypothetical protein